MTTGGSEAAMSRRTNVAQLRFRRPFSLQGIPGSLPAGDYQVETGEELILGLSFPAYRRVSTTLLLPVGSTPSTAREFAAVDGADLAEAQRRDALD